MYGVLQTVRCQTRLIDWQVGVCTKAIARKEAGAQSRMLSTSSDDSLLKPLRISSIAAAGCTAAALTLANATSIPRQHTHK